MPPAGPDQALCPPQSLTTDLHTSLPATAIVGADRPSDRLRKYFQCSRWSPHASPWAPRLQPRPPRMPEVTRPSGSTPLALLFVQWRHCGLEKVTGELPAHPSPAHPQCRWKREPGFLVWGHRPSCPPLPGLCLPTLLPVSPPSSELGHFLFAASPTPPAPQTEPPSSLWLPQGSVPNPGRRTSPRPIVCPRSWGHREPSCSLAPGPVVSPGIQCWPARTPSHLHQHLPECHEGPLAPSSLPG